MIKNPSKLVPLFFWDSIKQKIVMENVIAKKIIKGKIKRCKSITIFEIPANTIKIGESANIIIVRNSYHFTSSPKRRFAAITIMIIPKLFIGKETIRPTSPIDIM